MAKRARKNTRGSDLLDYPIVNESDADSDADLFLMWFGAYGDTKVLVWADSFDDAFEYAVDYFDDPKTCGVFTFTDESDYKAAADDEGIEWPPGGWDDLSEREQEKIRDAAEADLTVIGHTTLSCMPKKAWGAFVASYEWGGDDITGDDKKYVRAWSLASDDQAADLEKLGWRLQTSGGGPTGIWKATVVAGDEDYEAVLYDQRAYYALHGGDGRGVMVEIYGHKATAPLKTKKFPHGMGAGSVGASDPLLWVDEVEDELKWADDE